VTRGDGLVVGLAEPLRRVAGALLVASTKGEALHLEALKRVLEVGFSSTEQLVECAAFLAEFYEGEEGWLAKQIGVQEMVQELSYGGTALTGVVVEQWMRQRDMVRMVRLVDGLLAARLHLRHVDVLNVMLAMACAIALHKPQRAAALLAHVDGCLREGQDGVDGELLAEARQRMQVAEVVAAADQATREMWDQRLQRPGDEWTWTSGRERKALSDLAEWLTPGHAAEKSFSQVVPRVWWDLWCHRERVERQGELFAAAGRESGAETGVQAEVGWVPPHLVGAEEGVMLEDQVAGVIESVMERRARFYWLGGGVVMGWAMMVLLGWIWGFGVNRGPGAADQEEVEKIIGPGQDWMAWRLEELRGLAGDVMLMGGAEKLRGGAWVDQSGLLTGQTAELPLHSQRYRRMLAYLHLDPPLDAEVRVRLPRLLLDCAPDEDTLRLWERCLLAGVPLRREIALGAQEALGRPALRWDEAQRERLAVLAEGRRSGG
jgi:hypothetical protein